MLVSLITYGKCSIRKKVPCLLVLDLGFQKQAAMRQSQSKTEEPEQCKTEGSDAMKLRKTWLMVCEIQLSDAKRMWADLVGEV